MGGGNSSVVEKDTNRKIRTEKKKRKQSVKGWTYYARKKAALRMKARWESYTPEQRAAIAKKIKKDALIENKTT